MKSKNELYNEQLAAVSARDATPFIGQRNCPDPIPMTPLPDSMKLPNGEPDYDRIYRVFNPPRDATEREKIEECKKAYREGQWAGAVERDKVYAERNRLVCALSKLWPSHLAQHPVSDPNWDPQWLNIVCIHAPCGQLCWHIMDRELPMFEHLPLRANDWDGHTTEQKYERLASWQSHER